MLRKKVMLNKFAKITLLLIFSVLVLVFIFFRSSGNCSISHVSTAFLKGEFDYLLIRNTDDLDSSEFIDKKDLLYRDIKKYIADRSGFVFVTNGYQIVGCRFYKGMMYILTEKGSPGTMYVTFFEGSLKGPYKFATPQPKD